MIKFPYYLLREYERVFIEGEYKCIETAKNRYVLDMADLSKEDLSYAKRRVELLRRVKTLPYRIYPVNVIISNLTQFIGYGARNLYADDGTIVRWTKQKFYPIEDHLIQRTWVTAGKQFAEIKDVGTLLVTPYNGEKYAKIVHFGNQRLFYGYADRILTKPRRIKL